MGWRGGRQPASVPRPHASTPHPSFLPGMVEIWLGRLVEGMHATVKGTLRAAVKAAPTAAPADLVLHHPAQAALLALQWLWTTETQVQERGRGAKGN